MLSVVTVVMQTLDVVSGLHNCREFSQPLECLYQATQTQEKKNFYCCYKITFPRRKKNSLFRLLIKREILTSREVLYTKLNVRVISSCFAIKLLSKKGFSRLKCQLKRKKNDTAYL